MSLRGKPGFTLLISMGEKVNLQASRNLPSVGFHSFSKQAQIY
jgi:hypothetical protein